MTDRGDGSGLPYTSRPADGDGGVRTSQAGL